MKHILITGGCGYTGTILTNKLLDAGNKVTVIDTQWFGNFLNSRDNLNILKQSGADEIYDAYEAAGIGLSLIHI